MSFIEEIVDNFSSLFIIIYEIRFEGLFLVKSGFNHYSPSFLLVMIVECIYDALSM